ncbi:nucleoprotein TPR-like [Chironomus tepperi]|uniref:nucleoprotein TPR-like n=1 Tax=Chironomus tepperi TaxID=113505 RepID=UPI00391EEC31
MESNSQKLKISSIESGITTSDKVTEPIPSTKSPEVNGQSQNNAKIPSENIQKSLFNLESQLKEARQEREEAMEDRDRLFKILERRSMEIERLEADSKTMRQQLQASINAKCEAVRKYEEVQHKMTEIEFKEKRLDQERILSQNQLEMMSNDLTRNIHELQQCRKESTMRIMMLESKLHEKSTELKMSTMNEAQLRESNEMLTSKVDEMSKEILKLNEDFTASIKKYQHELSSKSRLVELFKEKSEDAVTVQKEVTSVVAELRASLKEATDEYGLLETKMKQKDIEHQHEVEELTKLIEDLKHELQNGNELLEAAKRENLEIAVEKLCPSAVPNQKLSKSGHSITQVYSMYVNASEDLDVLNMEHEKLKETFTAVVQEIEEKAPEIQKCQVELRKLRDAYQILSADYRALKDDKIIADGKVEMLMSEVSKVTKKFKDMQRENKDLSAQVCQLLHVIDGKPMMRKVGNNFVGENYVTFNNVEELQANNMKLVALVHELSDAISQIESGTKVSDDVDDNLKITAVESKPIQAEKLETSVIDSKEYMEVTQKLQKSEQDLNILKTQQIEALAKSNATIEQLTIQLDQIKSQLSETSSTNYKLCAEVEHKEAQLKIQQKNFDMTKRKLQSLEDKMKNSGTTAAKLEVSLAHLRDELQSCSSKLSRSEMSIANLTKENKNLIKLEAQLRTENEMYKKHQQLHSQMMSSLESIKATVERQESEKSSTKMAEKMNEMSQKCEELQQQARNFKDFETQANATIEELEGELQRVQDELLMANEEIDKKSKKIVEISMKILTNDEECQSDPESDTELGKLKENVTQLRKIGKRYKDQYLTLKDDYDSIKSENDKLTAQIEDESRKLNESMDKEMSTKVLLGKARSLITKLNDENEELKHKIEEIEKKSLPKESQSDKSSTELPEAQIEASEGQDQQMEPIKAEEPKSMSQKRQRDDKNDKNEATNESETEVTEKRAKIEQVPLKAPETSKIEEPATAEMEVEKYADNQDEKIQENSLKNENLDENLAAEVKIDEDQHAVEVTNDEKTGHEVVAENCDVITIE